MLINDFRDNLRELVRAEVDDVEEDGDQAHNLAIVEKPKVTVAELLEVLRDIGFDIESAMLLVFHAAMPNLQEYEDQLQSILDVLSKPWCT